MDVEALAIACGGVLVKSIRNAIWGYVFKMSIICKLLAEIEKALLEGDFRPEGSRPSQIIPRLQRIVDTLKADSVAIQAMPRVYTSAEVATLVASALASAKATSAPVPTPASSASAPIPPPLPPAPASAPTALEMLSNPFKNTDQDVFAEGQNAFSVIASSELNHKP